MDELPIIALRTESSTKELRWRKLLAGVNCTVLAGIDLVTSQLQFDIAMTDGTQLRDVPAFAEAPPDTYGVIAIGAELVCDVAFPDEPTERELRLACDLLYQIVQLRRARAASQQTQKLLTEMAELDALTGLANRRAWEAELARRRNRIDAADATLCLALFDLDHFKKVNTTHGYPAADKVLQYVGRALQAGVRADDFVARIGGDEFGVLLSSISAERAAAVVERIRASIESFLERSGVAIVTATAGFAVARQSVEAAGLFAVADANLRQGKSAGRNRTVASV